jgi:Sugar (and other) transporter
MPTKQQSAVGTLLQVLNGSIALIGCLYFYCISKYWVWLQLFGWSLNLIVVVALFFVPESPKYLLAKKRWQEAREILA